MIKLLKKRNNSTSKKNIYKQVFRKKRIIKQVFKLFFLFCIFTTYNLKNNVYIKYTLILGNFVGFFVATLKLRYYNIT